MTLLAAIPKGLDVDTDGAVVATCVVPAPNGCNLNCPYCIIRQRGEAQDRERFLQPVDYQRFLRDLSRHRRLSLIAIQGYEPLLPEAWSHTAAILAEGRAMAVPTALVTNGTHLARFAPNLAALGVASVAVSLDGGDAGHHDAMRGVPGTFDQVMAGLHEASTTPTLGDRLTVASVMTRHNAASLAALPEHLASLGIFSWVVTPLYRAGANGGAVLPVSNIVEGLLTLLAAAARWGVTLIVDDELKRYEQLADQLRLRLSVDETGVLSALRHKTLPDLNRVYRLSPSGRVITAARFLEPESPHHPIWNPAHKDLGAILADLDGGHSLGAAA